MIIYLYMSVPINQFVYGTQWSRCVWFIQRPENCTFVLVKAPVTEAMNKMFIKNSLKRKDTGHERRICFW